jgi:hypothetical protein
MRSRAFADFTDLKSPSLTDTPGTASLRRPWPEEWRFHAEVARTPRGMPTTWATSPSLSVLTARPLTLLKRSGYGFKFITGTHLTRVPPSTAAAIAGAHHERIDGRAITVAWPATPSRWARRSWPSHRHEELRQNGPAKARQARKRWR